MNRWLNKLSIRGKLLAVIGLVVVLGIGAIAWTTSSLRAVDREMSALFRELQHNNALQELRATVLLAEIAGKNYLETGDARYQAQHELLKEEAQTHLQAAQATSREEQLGQTSQQLQAGLAAYHTTFAQMTELVRAGEKAEALRLSQEMSEPQMTRLQELITADLASDRAIVQAQVEDAHSSVSTVSNLGLLLALLFLLSGSLLGIFLSGLISRPLKAISHSFEEVLAQDLSEMAVQLQKLSNGDLSASFRATAETLPVRSGDEVGRLVRSYNLIVERLHEVERTFARKVRSLSSLSSEIQQGAQEVGVASAQILSSVSEHSAGTTQQSAAISEVTATVDQIRATAEQTAERAQEVSQRAEESARVSREGRNAAQHIMESMEDIYQKVNAIAEDILALSEQTQQIGDITGTVNDIADQSNLLALNATIEAAKAGEHGKGFAVVASEVRNLADQAKKATTQVQAILGEIQKMTNAAVMATEQGAKVVQEGIELTRQAGHVINELSQTIEQSSRSAHQIAVSARQQSQGMDQIAHAIADINRATVQFSSSAQLSQNSAQDLDDLARQLLNVAAGYKLASEYHN